MFCQVCGLRNPDDEEFCGRCHSKLLVLSGVGVVDEATGETQEEIPFDEHVLERISTLEDIVKRTGEALKSVLETIGNLEKNLFVAHTGVLALQEALERQGAVRPEEVLDLWETKMDERMQAVEKKDRFLERRDRIVAGFGGEDRDDFLRRLREAEFAILALDAGRGIKILEELYRYDRGNVELGFYLAETYFSGGDLEKAGVFFKKILAVEPNHFESLVYSGISASERGESDEAESLLTRSIERKPEAFLPHFALGALYANGAEWDGAERELSRAIEVAPVPAARVLLGTVLREKGDISRAIGEFEEALATQPDSEDASFQLGLCYIEKNRPRRALECFQQALEKNPRKLEYQEAVRLLERRKRYSLPGVKGPGAEAYRQAEEAVSHGALQRGLELYRKAMSAEPENSTIRISYALLAGSLGQSHEAIESCRHVLAGEPEDVVAAAACSTLAEALAESGEDLDSALEYAGRALSAAPDELKPYPLAALGWVHYKRQEFDRAIDCLRKSSERAAQPMTFHHLGMAYLAAGRAEEAKAAFAKAKTVSRGLSLEDRMMQQVRSNIRLVEKVGGKKKTETAGVEKE